MFSKITNMLRTCGSEDAVLPPTELYNERWMLRLILDWFSIQPPSGHPLSFEKKARWYSEILLPSQFPARFQKDPNAEVSTHADGVIGHFSIGRSEKNDIALRADATQFTIIAAKIFTKLTEGIKNFKSYDQAARTVACMAETLSIGKRPINDFSRLDFFVIAPERQFKFETTFQTFLHKDSIRIKVQKRIKGYSDRADAETKNRWFETWFLPALESVDIQCITWEDIISYIRANDRRNGNALLEFYQKCLSLNQPQSRFSTAEEGSAPLSAGKRPGHRVLTKLRSMGLVAHRPGSDRGIAIEVKSLEHPGKIIKVQVKTRNPKYDPNWRWFQISVQPKELSEAKKKGIEAEQTWIDKVNKADFFVLDAVKHDEMWVLPKEKIFELIKFNRHKYGSRPDNVFNYEAPLKQKQKEMNLDIEVEGEKLTQTFAEYRENFQLILDSINNNG